MRGPDAQTRRMLFLALPALAVGIVILSILLAFLAVGNPGVWLTVSLVAVGLVVLAEGVLVWLDHREHHVSRASLARHPR